MSAPSWVVWRQDDNGNRFEVPEHDDEESARKVAETLEARGHKQLYYVERSIEDDGAPDQTRPRR